MQQQTAREAGQTVKEFLADLDRYEERVPLDELIQRLETLQIRIDDVRKFVHFGRERYQRNLMHEGPGYQALILCWRKSKAAGLSR